MIVNLTWEYAMHVSRNMREVDFREVMANRRDDDRLAFAAECMRLPGPRLACLADDGEPVAIGGIAMHLPGVGQAWLIGTPRIGKQGVEMAHTCKGLIQRLFDDGVVHRVQAFSAGFHAQAHQWLKAIGFKEESRMPGYGKSREEFLTFSVVKGG